MGIPASRKANNVPGNTLRVTTEVAMDADGNQWPKDTKFQLIASGYRQGFNRHYAEVIIDGKQVLFLGAR